MPGIVSDHSKPSVIVINYANTSPRPSHRPWGSQGSGLFYIDTPSAAGAKNISLTPSLISETLVIKDKMKKVKYHGIAVCGILFFVTVFILQYLLPNLVVGQDGETSTSGFLWTCPRAAALKLPAALWSPGNCPALERVSLKVKEVADPLT